MARRRIAQLPLHGGKAPAWLFQRMTRLAGAITQAIVLEYGPAEMLRRLADPWWFQAFGSVLGFDWHSSGVTTVTCGALKEAFQRHGADLGICVAGGKGGVSRKTPSEISAAADTLAISSAQSLIACSKITARIDSAAVQDGYTLYHHCFFFTPEGQWCVVQQGMSDAAASARRYHWLGESVTDFVCEPHAAIHNLAADPAESLQQERREPGEPNCETEADSLLNMVAREAAGNREASMQVLREHPDRILREVQQMTEGPSLFAPRNHSVLPRNINRARLKQLIPQLHDQQPADYRALLELEGVGPAAVRSLALLAEIIFQAPACHRDPAANPRRGVADSEVYEEHTPPQSPQTRRWADYAFAHGGKDGTPFPVDCQTYDRNIEILAAAVEQAKIDRNDRFHALRKLAEYREPTESVRRSS